MIETERLFLRPFEEADVAPFAALNADPRAMEHLMGPVPIEETRAMVGRIRAHHASRGFGVWAVEVRGVAPFVGCVGLTTPRFVASFTPCVEILWRVAAEHWGKGYAREAARASLAHGFGELGMKEILAFTVAANVRSLRVMTALGMTYAGTFEHPMVPDGHALKTNVIYKATPPAPSAR